MFQGVVMATHSNRVVSVKLDSFRANRNRCEWAMSPSKIQWPSRVWSSLSSSLTLMNPYSKPAPFFGSSFPASLAIRVVLPDSLSPRTRMFLLEGRAEDRDVCTSDRTLAHKFSSSLAELFSFMLQDPIP